MTNPEDLENLKVGDRVLVSLGPAVITKDNGDNWYSYTYERDDTLSGCAKRSRLRKLPDRKEGN